MRNRTFSWQRIPTIASTLYCRTVILTLRRNVFSFLFLYWRDASQPCESVGLDCVFDWGYCVGYYKQHELNAMVDEFKKTWVAERGNDVWFGVDFFRSTLSASVIRLSLSIKTRSHETDNCSIVGRNSFSWVNQLVCSCIIASFLYFLRSYPSPHNGAYMRCYKIADELNERLICELHLSNQLLKH